MQLSISLRPTKYARIVGQPIAVRLLQAMTSKSLVPRCVLLSGPSGVGKTTLARIFAAAVNCDQRGPDQEPCQECYHCKSILASESSIVLEIEAATSRKVEDMDEVRQIVSYAVPSGKRRIVIIDEFHTISDTAQESLLHLLEALALDTTFVLTTTRKDSINDAILGRTLPIELSGISTEERTALVKQYFTDYGLQIDERVLPVIAQARFGLRSVWQLVDKLKLEGKEIGYEQALDVLGLVGGERLDALIKSSTRSLLGLMDQGQKYQKVGVEWHNLLDALFSFAEDLIILLESGEIRCTSGATEACLESAPWSKAQCLAMLGAYHELSFLDWKTGLPRLYSVLHRPEPAAAVNQAAPTSTAQPASKVLTLADKLNQDPAWALVCKSIGGRVVEAVA